MRWLATVRIRALAWLVVPLVGMMPAPGGTADRPGRMPSASTVWLNQDRLAEVTSWYASIREQRHNTATLLHARPGPPGKPTRYLYAGVPLGPERRLRFAIGMDPDEFARSAGVWFEIRVDGRLRFKRRLAPGRTPHEIEYLIRLAGPRAAAADLELVTRGAAEDTRDRAFWRRLALE